jgi:hypothetical protein
MGDTERFEEWEGGVAVCQGLGRTRVILICIKNTNYPLPFKGRARVGMGLKVCELK